MQNSPGSCIKRQLERREKIIPVGHARSVMLSVKFIFAAAARTGHSFVDSASLSLVCVLLLFKYERAKESSARESACIYKKGGERIDKEWVEGEDGRLPGKTPWEPNPF
jgi:hypothetical protein